MIIATPLLIPELQLSIYWVGGWSILGEHIAALSSLGTFILRNVIARGQSTDFDSEHPQTLIIEWRCAVPGVDASRHGGDLVDVFQSNDWATGLPKTRNVERENKFVNSQCSRNWKAVKITRHEFSFPSVQTLLQHLYCCLYIYIHIYYNVGSCVRAAFWYGDLVCLPTAGGWIVLGHEGNNSLPNQCHNPRASFLLT